MTNDDTIQKEVKQLRDSLIDFLLETIDAREVRSDVVVNAILNILSQMVHISCEGDIDAIRDVADEVKSAMIDYGVAHEKIS